MLWNTPIALPLLPSYVLDLKPRHRCFRSWENTEPVLIVSHLGNDLSIGKDHGPIELAEGSTSVIQALLLWEWCETPFLPMSRFVARLGPPDRLPLRVNDDSKYCPFTSAAGPPHGFCRVLTGISLPVRRPWFSGVRQPLNGASPPPFPPTSRSLACHLYLYANVGQSGPFSGF